MSDRPFVPLSRVSARKAQAGTKGQDEEAPAQTDRTGRLTPWADPVMGTLGWQVTALSRRLTILIAEIVPATKISAHGKREWCAYIPQSVLAVTVMSADTVTLQCTIGLHPQSGILILVFAPWPAATVLKCPTAALPARGMLSVRSVQITTRMGRPVRYLVPEFIPP